MRLWQFYSVGDPTSYRGKNLCMRLHMSVLKCFVLKTLPCKSRQNFMELIQQSGTEAWGNGHYGCFFNHHKFFRDHSSITSAKRWVGGVRKWQFLLIYLTIYADVSGWVGLKKPKTCWRNTWMIPYRNNDVACRYETKGLQLYFLNFNFTSNLSSGSYARCLYSKLARCGMAWRRRRSMGKRGIRGFFSTM